MIFLHRQPDGGVLRGIFAVGPGGPGLNRVDNRIRGPPRERKEESRVGTECVSTCRSRWSSYHEKNNKIHKSEYKKHTQTKHSTIYKICTYRNAHSNKPHSTISAYD